jgi:opacity protein-like surface antigen
MKKLIFAAIATASLMTAAHAENGYVGLGITSVDHSADVAGSTNRNAEGYKAGGKIFGGIELDKTWGLEAGYTDFRSAHNTYTIGTTNGSVDTKGHAFYVAGKGTFAVNDQVGVFGKLGVANTKTELNFNTGSTFANSSDSKTEAYGALGVQYNLSKQVALTAEYERYGKSKNIGAKANAFTVAARYNF